MNIKEGEIQNLKILSLDMAIETKLAGDSKHLIKIANDIYEYLKEENSN